MTTFIDAMQTNDVVGENGMPTHSTAGSKLVDLFFKSGGSRKMTESQIIDIFRSAYDEDRLWAIRCLFYIRDIRGGMGERRFFRICLKWLAKQESEIARKIVHYVPIYGRWDDLVETLDTPVAKDAFNLWLDQLNDDSEKGNKHSLAAKWFPRDGKWFGFARRQLKTDRKTLRKGLVQWSTTVEQLMSTNRWADVDYEKLPSKALHMYRKAFAKRDTDRYNTYQQAVASGKAKMNAKALFPSDVVKAVMVDFFESEKVANENAWANLADIGLNDQKILPVCDVSGSMNGEPMAVSVALGLYLSERNTSAFKNVIVTFSNEPAFHKVSGRSLYSKVESIMHADWGMSTDLEKTFRVILQRAQENDVAAEDMPSKILIISDMQFNRATRYPNANALKMIRKEYEESGYEMPQIVFWNVRTSTGVPAKFDEKGVFLVSGYSPSIMKSVVSGKAVNPIELVLDTLNGDRYSAITL
jgi:hypothetical protein